MAHFLRINQRVINLDRVIHIELDGEAPDPANKEVVGRRPESSCVRLVMAIAAGQTSQSSLRFFGAEAEALRRLFGSGTTAMGCHCMVLDVRPRAAEA